GCDQGCGTRRQPQTSRLQLGPQAQGGRDQPAARPAGGQVGLEQYELRSPAPGFVSPPAEPVTRRSCQAARVRYLAPDEGTLGTRQLGLRKILCHAVATQDR